MVCSSFNNQYYRAGIRPLPSLGEIKLRRGEGAASLSVYGTFRMDIYKHSKNAFSSKSREILKVHDRGKIMTNK